MKYAIGQKVWVLFTVHPPLGEFAGIVEGYDKRDGLDIYIVDAPDHPAPINGSTHPGKWGPEEWKLRPRDEPKPPESQQLGEWELCPWQPPAQTVDER